MKNFFMLAVQILFGDDVWFLIFFVYSRTMSKKTICLNMIVKNEAHIIRKTLENLSRYIHFDYWVISDTGSTDDTKKIITDFFHKKKIPGEMLETEWIDFAHNRTEALEAAYNKTDYLLIFDADDSIHKDFIIPNQLTADGYMLRFGSSFIYHRTLLINNRKRWKFVGVLHEYIHPIDNVRNPFPFIEGDYYIESGRKGARNLDPDKYFKDAQILEKAFDQEKEEGLKNRYAFYCAQSYRNHGNTHDAITWYTKCLDLNNWVQEKYYSCLMLGDLYQQIGNEKNALKYWLKTVEYDDQRLEGIAKAMRYMRENDMHIMVNLLYYKYKTINKTELKNKLFIDMTHYNNSIEYENSISAFYVNDKKSGYECCKTILMNDSQSDFVIERTLKNILFYSEYLDNDQDEHLFNKLDDLLYTCSALKQKNIKITSIENVWERLYNNLKPVFTKYKNPAHVYNMQTIKSF